MLLLTHLLTLTWTLSPAWVGEQECTDLGSIVQSGNIVYAFDIKTIRWLLKWTLGGYVFTDLDNLHEIYASDDTDLPSFTARLGKDLFEHVFAGCKD